jgi:hypothetical protein
LLNFNNKFYKISWRKAFFILNSLFSKILAKNKKFALPLQVHLGEFIDLESVFLLKRMICSVGLPLASNFYKYCPDFFIPGLKTSTESINSLETCFF